MNTKTEDLAEVIRLVRSNEAWFDASHEWLRGETGPDPRPLSLGSMEALRRMGMHPFEPDAPCEMSEARQLAYYRWLHTAPLHRVRVELWHGTWPLLIQEEPGFDDIVLASWRDECARIAQILRAVTITVRPRPRSEHDRTPADVIGPSLQAFRATLVSRALGCTLDHAFWHTPLVQALQVYHVALWESNRWTVLPGEKPTTEQLKDLAPEWMTEANADLRQPVGGLQD